MNYTNEEGRLIIVAEDGTETPVYAALKGGVLHCMVRAVNKATFDAVGLSVGLLRYENPAQDAVLDEEGNVIQEAVEASGELVPESGITINRMGPHVITPAVLDDEGNELVPAIVDERYHVNFWLAPEVVARGQWEVWSQEWMKTGNPGNSNKSEKAKVKNGIELLDPMTISTPSNVLL